MSELPPGAYERVITQRLKRQLRELPSEFANRERLEPEEAPDFLRRHLGNLILLALRSVPGSDTAKLKGQIELTNRIARIIAEEAPNVVGLDDLVAASHDLLLDLVDRVPLPGERIFPARPETPLSASALLVNGRDQPRIGSEVQRELASADSVDLLCAFIRWHGLRVLEQQIADFTARGCPLRVLTTTYIGATERRALDRLVELGAQVKISYETQMTRLHAKAWLFHRNTGYSTAYVGSSNLSKSAMLDGLEWNVRLTEVDQGHLLDTFRATFEEYWHDPAFEPYDPSDVHQRERLDRALETERAGPAALPIDIATVEVHPWGFQQEILDQLDVERKIHGRWRSLVVMATGTGKTVVSGLDYRRLRGDGHVDTLLFVAHREELLAQSIMAFRHIMRDGSFGERFVAGERPTVWRHVFASIQSLARLDVESLVDPTRFDMIVIDEFHHAAEESRTYGRLLRHLEPKVLLGLTATPERSDGLDVTTWFGGRIAVELRLWEALERGLLSPFQYFGLHDGTDLQAVSWKRGMGYDPVELTNVYTGHDARTRIIIQALKDKVSDVSAMRAIGYCVSIGHAEFMAQKFESVGIAARAITSRSSWDERKRSLYALKAGDVKILFTVDLFNEGIDLPAIDTILFLRPTESATVFLQQLGRGLRLAENKPCLTVLDFIGNQHAGFRFDLRYRELTGTSRRGLAREIEHGFPTLPPGCHIELDRVAADIVMQSVRSSLRINWRGFVAELRRIGDCTLETFVDETGIDVEDIYRGQSPGWAGLRRLAGFDDNPVGDEDMRLSRAIGRMLHIDDQERIQFIRRLVDGPNPPEAGDFEGRGSRLLAMLHFSLWGWDRSLDDLDNCLRRLWMNPSRRCEISEVMQVLASRLRRLTPPVSADGPLPLHVHARYSLPELLAAFGVPNPAASRGVGVKRIESERADVFWFNLRKTERHFSPTTMYADRAISPTLFQWESQSTTSASSRTGQNYIHQQERGTSVHLFFRESKEGDGARGAPPYLYAGPATYVSHSSERPMRIIWKLDHELPADVFHSARVAVA
jgi:superfamily II DNA or RNA helicase/HKD family nuclease